MGAVNYHTSEFITLGLKPYNTNDFINDHDFLDYIKNELNTDINDHGAVLAEAYDYITELYDCDRMNIEAIINNYDFRYFKIEIIPGYYEGFTIDIESDFDFYDYADKKAAQKEITQLKKLLIDCAGCGLVEVWPGWVTSYKDYKTTLNAINAAVKEMREAVKKESTWNQCNRKIAA